MSGGATVTMDYDAGGRLARRASTSAGTTYMLWDGANLVSELNASGLQVAEYSYYGMDRLHSMVIGSTYYQAHQDAQGNVLALTDQNRNLARTYNYEDFGRTAGGTDYANLAGRDRARWKGALWMGPEVELYYMRNRWYEPQSGRFLSEDPIGLGGGINPYAFAGDQPVFGFDPLGLDGAPDKPYKWCYDQKGVVRLCETDHEINVVYGDCFVGCGAGIALVGNQYNAWLAGSSTSDGSVTPAAGHGSSPSGTDDDGSRSCGSRFAEFAISTTLDVLTWGAGGIAARLATRAEMVGTRALVYAEIGLYATEGRGAYGLARLRRTQAAVAALGSGTLGAANMAAGLGASAVFDAADIGSVGWEAAKILVPFVGSFAAGVDWAKNCW